MPKRDDNSVVRGDRVLRPGTHYSFRIIEEKKMESFYQVCHGVLEKKNNATLREFERRIEGRRQ